MRREQKVVGFGRDLMGWGKKRAAGLVEASATLGPSLDFILRPQEVFGEL